jgi:hypothetical protein
MCLCVYVCMCVCVCARTCRPTPASESQRFTAPKRHGARLCPLGGAGPKQQPLQMSILACGYEAPRVLACVHLCAKTDMVAAVYMLQLTLSALRCRLPMHRSTTRLDEYHRFGAASFAHTGVRKRLQLIREPRSSRPPQAPF